MKTFATSATVEDHGRVHLADVPFAPGTKVEVTISEKAITSSTVEPTKPTESLASVRELFTRVTAKNTESIGPLCRATLLT
jgi:hypothetical protein